MIEIILLAGITAFTFLNTIMIWCLMQMFNDRKSSPGCQRSGFGLQSDHTAKIQNRR